MTPLHLQLAAELDAMAAAADMRGSRAGEVLRAMSSGMREHGAVESAEELRTAFAMAKELAAEVDASDAHDLLRGKAGR